MKKTIYVIPGVGADETVFSKLIFPAGMEVKCLKWEKPHPDENLRSYVKRLVPQIKKDTEPILVGLSFGGIVSIELAKLVNTHKIFIISSIKTHFERPYKMSLFNLLKFYRYFPVKLAVKFDFWHRWAFGPLTSEERQMIDRMIQRVDLEFNKWAVEQSISWKNTDVPENLVHIHGDRDSIFPHIYIRNYYKIPGGTHFMIVNKAKEISEIILNELEGKPGVIESGKNRRNKYKHREKAEQKK